MCGYQIYILILKYKDTNYSSKILPATCKLITYKVDLNTLQFFGFLFQTEWLPNLSTSFCYLN